MAKTNKIILLLSLLLIPLALFGIGQGYFSYEYRQSLGSKLHNNNEFGQFLAAKRKLPQKGGEVSFIAVGDISFSRSVERMVKVKNDIHYPLLKMRSFIQSGDLVFGNLETPIIEGEEIPTGQMIFRSNPGIELALKEAGFSIFSLANNHTPNFGEQGLINTFNYLDAAGIKYVGAGKNNEEANAPVYHAAKGIKLAFLAYNDTDVVPDNYEADEKHSGTAFMRPEQMAEAVKKAGDNADLVIVSMHSGAEYVEKPNQNQINFARAAIDAGADLVLGHHPHVVQTVEQYKGKYIFYSLGNFIFDQPWSEDTKEGLALKISFTKAGVRKISLWPYKMKNLAQPEPAEEKIAEKILKRLDFPLANQIVYSWDGKEYKKSFKAAIYEDKNEAGGVISKNEIADLDNSAVQETYALENGILSISENSNTVWQSPKEWWIDDFVLEDSTGDGILDINLSLWKAGNYGESKPFWVRENDMSVKNHFFVFDYLNGKIKSVWNSSNLGAPNCEFKLADLNKDGKNELVALEGDYGPKDCQGKYVAVWQWNGWGFSNDWRSEEGNFSHLEIEKDDGKIRVITDSL